MNGNNVHTGMRPNSHPSSSTGKVTNSIPPPSTGEGKGGGNASCRWDSLIQQSVQNLWPDEANYEGTNKPYEGQVSDHKRQLIAAIKQGVTGKAAIEAGDVETLISTRHKRGYKLNFARENVLILKKQDILFVALAAILHWNEFFSDFILNIEELLILC